MYLSIVVPCYNEEQNIKPFYEAASKTAGEIAGEDYEIIFVDDGSSDNTLDGIKQIASEDKKIKYVSFTRNFGKESAIYAGLSESEGEICALLDADLQHPPDKLLEMERILEENEEIDSVAMRRVTRKGEPVLRSLFSKFFYKLINKISDINIVEGSTDFRLMKKRMVDAVLSLKERKRFSKGIFAWVGFKTEYLEIENIERTTGESKWSFLSLFKYAIEGIFSFSSFPLTMVAVIGILLSVVAVIMGIYFIIHKLFFGIEIPGYATLVTLILFLGGVQILCIGVCAIYIGKVFIEVKKRPLYVIKEKSKK